jgi:hypothetical protein
MPLNVNPSQASTHILRGLFQRKKELAQDAVMAGVSLSSLRCQEDWARGIERCIREMKDVHTLNHEPSRLGYWVQMAREEIDHA